MKTKAERVASLRERLLTAILDYRATRSETDARIIFFTLRPFAVWWAKRIGFPECHRDHLDLIQTGRWAALDACLRLDESEAPSSMLAYVMLYIRGRMHRYAIERTNAVRLPVQLYGNRRPKGESKRRVSIPTTLLFSEMPDRANANTERSFEDALTDDGPLEDEVVEEGKLQEAIRHVVAYLMAHRWSHQTERLTVVRRVLRDPPDTLAEIGADHGLSRERIRQHESRFLLDSRDHLDALLSSEARQKLVAWNDHRVSRLRAHDRYRVFEDWVMAVYALLQERRLIHST